MRRAERAYRHGAKAQLQRLVARSFYVGSDEDFTDDVALDLAPCIHPPG